MTNVFETMRDLGEQAPRLYILVSGAGSGVQDRIWKLPGISNFFVGASMPYWTGTSDEELGFKPQKYVSVETAIDMAQTAYMRAWVSSRRAIGIGMTCSVASTEAHRGPHRIILALVDENGCWTVDLDIPKGKGESQRKLDGEIADDLVVQILTEHINGGLRPGLLITLHNRITAPVVRMDELARARILAHPLFLASGERVAAEDVAKELVPDDTTFFPGAFNPPHEGHFKGARAAMSFATGHHLVFSTTVNPPHKPALTSAEMLQRARMMKGHDFLLSEDDTLFILKARRFPGATFIVGADTMDRFLDPKWGPEVIPMLAEFESLGTLFLVLGRKIGETYTTANDVMAKHLKPDSRFKELFTPIPFRLDLSSTELRSAK